MLQDPKARPNQHLTDAAASMITAAFLFAVMGVTVKLASRALPQPMVVFLRCALSLVLVVPWLAAMRFPSLSTGHLREHIVRGVTGMAAMYCFFFALIHLGLAEALVLNYSLPLFIPLVERVWLREPIPRGIYRPLAIGALGLLLILKPGTAIFQPAALVGVLAAALAATAQVGVRHLTRVESISNIVFYFGLISALVSALPAALTWTTPPRSLWPTLLAMGLSATVAQLTMTRAYRGAPAATVGPFIYTSVVFGAAIDWLVFDKLPDSGTALGAVLVAVSATITLRLRR